MSQQKLLNGGTIEKFDEETQKKIKSKYPFYSDVIRVKPEGWVFQEGAAPILDQIYKFEFKPTDIITTSFPKSGTTWLQEIVWNLVNNPDGDNPTAGLNIDLRSPYIDGDVVFCSKNNPFKIDLSKDENLSKLVDVAKKLGHPDMLVYTHTVVAKDPRVIKTHLPLSFFKESTLDTVKVVYVARDPRDVIVSRFHFMRLLKIHSYQGTFDEHVDFFLNEQMNYNPYWAHVKQAWENRNHPNFHLVFYEDLKSNIFEELKKIDAFLGTKRTDQQIKQVIEFTNFKNMKVRAEKSKDEVGIENYFDKEVKETSGGFYRKGEVGDWKSKFTPAQADKIEKWMKKNEFCKDFRYKV